MFEGKDLLVDKDLTDKELEMLYNSGNISLSKVISYVTNRDKNQMQPYINERGEIIRKSEEINKTNTFIQDLRKLKKDDYEICYTNNDNNKQISSKEKSIIDDKQYNEL